jgi:cytochrome c oxidase assembly protein subunit 15
MLHRYLAGALVLVIIALAVLAWRNRRDPQQPRRLPVFLVGLVVFQALLGMWTVTLLLKPLIVVLHLLGGLATLSLLAWLAWGHSSFPATDAAPAAAASEMRNVPFLRKIAAAALVVLALQIALGGWTSSNYAALACPDFPTCQNSYWPQMDAKDAFILWRGLGIDYEGGVLDHPARVAIHFMHRLGAVLAALMLGFASIAAIRRGTTRAVRIAGVAVGAVLVCQLILGPVMVMRALPLALATAHNAVAALLLLAVVALNRSLAGRASSSQAEA